MEQARTDLSKEAQSEENSFFIPSFEFYFKYDNETCHWVGHSNMKPIGINYFIERKHFNDKTYTEEQVPK